MFSKISELYGDMWKAIARPPRDVYDVEKLGPCEFYWKKRRFKRRDFTLTNKRGLKIECSHFEPVRRDGSYDDIPRPCVIYMHGNSSSRLEAIHCGCLRLLLPLDISLVCFDFAGSGLSEGDYVSLGWYEQDDLEEVVAHLRARPTVSTIGLWGRSMGAVTACLFANKDPSIGALVIDSPFASLRRLAEELTTEFVGMRMPHWLATIVMNMIRNSVLDKAKFDLNLLEPIKHCSSSFIPALFIAANDDTFIRPQHAKDLYDAYAGDKNWVPVEGNHNSFRPPWLHDSIAIWFNERLLGHSPSSLFPHSGWDDLISINTEGKRSKRRFSLQEKSRSALLDESKASRHTSGSQSGRSKFSSEEDHFDWMSKYVDNCDDLDLDMQQQQALLMCFDKASNQESHRASQDEGSCYKLSEGSGLFRETLEGNSGNVSSCSTSIPPDHSASLSSSSMPSPTSGERDFLTRNFPSMESCSCEEIKIEGIDQSAEANIDDSAFKRHSINMMAPHHQLDCSTFFAEEENGRLYENPVIVADETEGNRRNEKSSSSNQKSPKSSFRNLLKFWANKS